jgi:hypothetical protein
MEPEMYQVVLVVLPKAIVDRLACGRNSDMAQVKLTDEAKPTRIRFLPDNISLEDLLSAAATESTPNDEGPWPTDSTHTDTPLSSSTPASDPAPSETTPSSDG